MKVVAGITIGQSPRTDMTDDLAKRLASNIKFVEYGALDEYSLEQIETELVPDPGDEILVSRMRDGSQAMFSGKKIVPLVQAKISLAEAEGADAIVLLCTGAFPAMQHTVPLIYPQDLLHLVAEALAADQKVAVMVPEDAQAEQSVERWNKDGIDVEVVCASPYGDPALIEQAAAGLRGSSCAFLCLDCMGFSLKMRELASRASGLDVLLPRTLVASILSELLS